MQYLLKTEPSEYSFADLVRDQSTIWDGVSNPQALKNLREMAPGDRLIIYHTGDQKSAVGTAVVTTVDDKNPRNPAITIKAGQKLSPVTLSAPSNPSTCSKILPWCAREDCPLYLSTKNNINFC